MIPSNRNAIQSRKPKSARFHKCEINRFSLILGHGLAIKAICRGSNIWVCLGFGKKETYAETSIATPDFC